MNLPGCPEQKSPNLRQSDLTGQGKELIVIETSVIMVMLYIYLHTKFSIKNISLTPSNEQ